MQQTSKPTIAVIGCGWLGFPLARHLASLHYPVVGTSRTTSTLEKLSALGITAQYADVYKPATFSTPALSNASTWVFTIAAGRKNTDFNAYVGAIQACLKLAKQDPKKQIVFVSTTAVYGNISGLVDEQTPTAPVTGSGKAHVAIEENIRQQFPQQHTILRLAGLVNRARHPVRTLCRKQRIENGQQRVNLVHQADVISALSAIIKQRPNNFGTLVLASSEHPRRDDYYRWAAAQLDLPQPDFIPIEETANDDTGKLIDARASCAAIGLTLRFASPYAMLAE
ncbi:NAD-dependent epimerase/dehydratase family protein [Alteromonas flava]|uniref:NAD-dependent epimerase/dehydratase family protein n=1 Tax=Alteromonas flava TaxID=2048003 RepID=UPI0013DAE074|nr:NAD(P)H-binding protein [Alteromonas flava]